MKNAILVDYDPGNDWDFLRGLENTSGEEWVVLKKINNSFGSFYLSIKRYLVYFFFPFVLLFSINKYKKILAWQQFYGIVLAFYLKFFRYKKSPEISIMTFIYKPKKGMLGNLYKAFVGYAIDCRFVKNIIVFSNSEKEYYGKVFESCKEKFRVEKLGIDPLAQIDIVVDDFFVSAGRSNRDYDFLIKEWDFGSLHIICEKEFDKNNAHITFLQDCFGEDYLKELARCKAVIIPLQDENISSGQLVIIQAMAMGKPCVVTENKTVSDYIDTGVNGIIIKKNKQELREALAKLADEKIYKQMSESALQKFVDCFSVFSMGARIGKYI